MPDTYLGIAQATRHNLHVDTAPDMPDMETYISTCTAMCNYVDGISPTALDSVSRSVEFHAYGIAGMPGGGTLAPMLWSIGNIAPFHAKMIGATSALMMTSFYEVVLMASHVETVYTVNATSNGVYNKVSTADTLANVTSVPWASFRTGLPTVDMAHVAIYHFADSELIQPVVDAVRPGGLLIVANASNGGEMYDTTRTSTFSQDVHDEIHAAGSFYSYHMQGYISYTVFVKAQSS